MAQKKLTLLTVYLLAHGLTQTEVAAAAGVHPKRLERLVHGLSGPTADERRQIAMALGTDEATIWDPFSSLSSGEASVERLLAWLSGDEGRLLLRRMVQASSA